MRLRREKIEFVVQYESFLEKIVPTYFSVDAENVDEGKINKKSAKILQTQVEPKNERMSKNGAIKQFSFIAA